MTGAALSLAAGARAAHADELEWLRHRWGDLVDDIGCTEGRWRGRWRTGDVRPVVAGTAQELDAALARVEEIIRLYQGGLSMAKVADKTSTGFIRVRRVIDLAGVARHRSSNVSEDEAAAIVAACTGAGMTRTQAAAQFRRAPSTIDAVLHRAGVIDPGSADLLHASTAAQVAGVDVETLRLLACRGRITSVRPSGRGHHWYYRTDIEGIAARLSQDVPPASAGDG